MDKKTASKVGTGTIVYVRIPPQNVKKIDCLAESQNRSRSAQIAFMLNEAMK